MPVDGNAGLTVGLFESSCLANGVESGVAHPDWKSAIAQPIVAKIDLVRIRSMLPSGGFAANRAAFWCKCSVGRGADKCRGRIVEKPAGAGKLRSRLWAVG
jgi:hypothetical protein